MHNLVIKNTKKLVILLLLNITHCLILEICRQTLNKKLSNIVNIIVKILISIVFLLLKVGDLFSVKESVPKYLRFFIVY